MTFASAGISTSTYFSAEKFRLGAESLTMTPEEFDQLIRREIAENEALVKAAGIKIE